MIVLLTAPPGTGKSTLMQRLVKEELFSKATGVITKELRSGAQRIGFSMENIKTNKNEIIAHKNLIHGKVKIGEYFVNPQKVLDSIKDIQINQNSVMFIDEVASMQCICSDFNQFVKKSIQIAKFCLISIVYNDEVKFANELKQDPNFLKITLNTNNWAWLHWVILHLKKKAFEYDSLSSEKKIEFNKTLEQLILNDKFSLDKALHKINEMIYFMR